jgi:hypothetical protein
MTTYKITNIVPDMKTMEMVVFYEFSTGDIFSNKVPLATPFADIQKWGEDKCVWFDEREVIIAEMQKQIALEEAQRLLEEQQVVDVVEEIIEQ